MKEIWKDVKGFEDYEVSTKGNVRNKITSKILKPVLCPNGYSAVCLYKKGTHKNQLVHRLVAFAFIDNFNKQKTEVNHKNGNKTDNTVSNLEWVTRQENLIHSYTVLKNGKIPIKVKCIETDKVYSSCYEASRENNCWHTKIVACCKGKRKTTGGYHWEYAEEQTIG